VNFRNTPGNRYWIGEPVKDGNEFFEVTDHKLDSPVASIRKDVPCADKLAGQIAESMELKNG
jgi:hypothetical protein